MAFHEEHGCGKQHSAALGRTVLAGAPAPSKAALDMVALQEHYDFGETTALKSYAYCPGLVRSNLRGTSEAAVSAGGAAGDPEVSGRGILAIIQGERDGDAGKFVNSEGGVYGW